MGIDNLVKKANMINNSKMEKFKENDYDMKVGIMGGTFDPVHYAHLATAEFIRDKYELDKILFIPSGNPPHKNSNITNKYNRFNMVNLATMNNKYFLVSDLEIKREEKTYTIDTLNYLKKTYENIQIYFITGADAICDIDTWKDVEKNFELATFIAATRPGISLLRVQEKIENLRKKYNANIINVYVPSLDISSTYIREQIKANKSVRYLVPEDVEKYIYDNQLYKGGEK